MAGDANTESTGDRGGRRSELAPGEGRTRPEIKDTERAGMACGSDDPGIRSIQGRQRQHLFINCVGDAHQ